MGISPHFLQLFGSNPARSKPVSREFFPLATLGQGERAKDWMGRALLIDPENLTMRYNCACALASHLNDKEAALEMLGPAFEKMGTFINHAKVDPDLDPLREDPRFKAMLEVAERRLGIQADRE